MAIACGKKARKKFGNRHQIKRAYRRRHARPKGTKY